MILRDELTVRKISPAGDGKGDVVAVVPCHIGYRRVEGATSSTPTTERNRLAQWVEAIVPPDTPWSPGSHEVEWHGEIFYLDGPAAKVMRGGEVHHLTGGLKRVEH